ncbi:MAG: hypothetical protein NZM04_02420 [Methylacidiphilales bacterium]|nr:hypothetical protein [Candidatus Methylacidiphilales bacterium]
MKPEYISILVRSGIPVLCLSSFGVGKTQFALSFARENINAHIVMLNMAALEPEMLPGVIYADHNGNPIIVGMHQFNELAKKIAQEPHRPILIFMDEVTHGNLSVPHIQSSMMTGIWSGYDFSPYARNGKLWYLLMGNSTKFSTSADTLPEPLINRCLVLEWGVTSADIANYYAGKYLNEKDIASIAKEYAQAAGMNDYEYEALVKKATQELLENGVLNKPKKWDWHHPDLPDASAVKVVYHALLNRISENLTGLDEIIHKIYGKDKPYQKRDPEENFLSPRSLHLIIKAAAILHCAGAPNSVIQEVCKGGTGNDQLAAWLYEKLNTTDLPSYTQVINWIEGRENSIDLKNKSIDWIVLFNEQAAEYVIQKIINEMSSQKEDKTGKLIAVYQYLDKALTKMKNELFTINPALQSSLLQKITNHPSMRDVNMRMGPIMSPVYKEWYVMHLDSKKKAIENNQAVDGINNSPKNDDEISKSIAEDIKEFMYKNINNTISSAKDEENNSPSPEDLERVLTSIGIGFVFFLLSIKHPDIFTAPAEFLEATSKIKAEDLKDIEKYIFAQISGLINVNGKNNPFESFLYT